MQPRPTEAGNADALPTIRVFSDCRDPSHLGKPSEVAMNQLWEASRTQNPKPPNDLRPCHWIWRVNRFAGFYPALKDPSEPVRRLAMKGLLDNRELALPFLSYLIAALAPGLRNSSSSR